MHMRYSGLLPRGELVLDTGCARGAVLISAAHRLPRGRATGADIWRLRDQRGNTRAAAERNAMVFTLMPVIRG